MKYIVTLESGCSSIDLRGHGFLSDSLHKIGNPKSIENVVIVECDYLTAHKISELPQVKSIEPESTGTLCSLQSRSIDKRHWFLGRIPNENHKTPTPSTYKFNRTGKGVDVYVIDTGIRHDHSEFLGKPVHTLYESKTAKETRAHGMMCSSLIMGNTYGVAPNANLYSLRTDLTNSDLVKCYDTILNRS